MKRGDIVIAAPPGAYGKPRPVIVLQADSFALPSVTVAPLTSGLRDTDLIRVPVAPSVDNGLQKPSQIMVDKIITMPLAKIGQHVGRLDKPTMQAVSRALVTFFDLDGATTP